MAWDPLAHLLGQQRGRHRKLRRRFQNLRPQHIFGGAVPETLLPPHVGPAMHRPAGRFTRKQGLQIRRRHLGPLAQRRERDRRFCFVQYAADEAQRIGNRSRCGWQGLYQFNSKGLQIEQRFAAGRHL